MFASDKNGSFKFLKKLKLSEDLHIKYLRIRYVRYLGARNRKA